MTRYTVEVVRYLTKNIEVEANSEQEAFNHIKGLLDNNAIDFEYERLCREWVECVYDENGDKCE